MPEFKYQKLCFSCGSPIASNRSDKIYCSEPCCTYSTRARLKHAPNLTTKEWIIHVENELSSSPLQQLKHPVKRHPINMIVPQLLSLQEQIKALLPNRVVSCDQV